MNRVVVDASALAAAIFDEPRGEAIRQRLDGAIVFAPELLKFELASVAARKARRCPADSAKIMAALAAVPGDACRIVWQDINVTDVVLVSQATGTTAYDASYLWLAGFLGADLVTLDARLAAAV